MSTTAATETKCADNQRIIFQELEAYAWDTDPQFQMGLSAILGPEPQPSQILELTLRAQIFYYSRKKNVPIDFDAYKKYLSTEPKSSSPQSYSSINTPTPSYVGPPINPDRIVCPPHGESSSIIQAPYPANFYRIVEMITNGEPIPGIKEIPNTVLHGQGMPSHMPKRRKPWESADKVSDDQVQGRIGGTFGDRRDEVLDQELPSEEA